MADKYLKEDGSGGYELEDGSGVLILEGIEPITGSGGVSFGAPALAGTGTVANESRVSQTPLLVGVTPIPDARVSQTVLQVATTAPKPINVSQVVLLVATHDPVNTRVGQTVLLVAVPTPGPSVGYSWAQVIG